MTTNFANARRELQKMGFYAVTHPVVVHHLRKDFTDYDVSRTAFYILPAGEDFIHVAVVEHMTAVCKQAVQIRYTLAGDDLLYGLRSKYRCGGSVDNEIDIARIDKLLDDIQADLDNDLAASPTVRNHQNYIRKRFRHGRVQAKVRAFFIMLKDKWRWAKTGQVA